jgi:uncharacterized phiE125 gp8 family phage protein
MAKIEGTTTLLTDGRFPYDGLASNVVWPVILSEIKLHAQISHDAEDDLLHSDFGGYLADAVEEIEARGQVSLIYQRRRLTLDRMPCEETIQALRGPLVSVEQIQYLDSNSDVQMLADTYYRIDGRSKRGGVYFKDTSGLDVDDGDGVVWIDMTCGYGETSAKVPAQWRQLIAIVATHSYQRRELASGGGLDDAMERVINRKIVIAGGSRRYV